MSSIDTMLGIFCFYSYVTGDFFIMFYTNIFEFTNNIIIVTKNRKEKSHKINITASSTHLDLVIKKKKSR